MTGVQTCALPISLYTDGGTGPARVAVVQVMPSAAPPAPSVSIYGPRGTLRPSALVPATETVRQS